jgi:hypothetical protein
MPQLTLVEAVDLCQWIGVPESPALALGYLQSDAGQLKIIKAFCCQFRTIDLKIALTGEVDLCYSRYDREQIRYLSSHSLVRAYQQAILEEIENGSKPTNTRSFLTEN